MAHDEFLVPRLGPTLSRRDVVKYGALGAGTALLGLPLWGLAKRLTPTDHSAFDFVTRYFAARDQAVLENAPGLMFPLIDPSNSAMLSFEVDRVARLHHAAHDEWHGSHKRVYSKVSSLSVSATDKASLRLKVRQTLAFDWHYDPSPVPPSVEDVRQSRPNAESLSISLANPDGTFPQRWGIDHEITLQTTGSGFKVAADAYVERFLASPDAGGGFRSYPGGSSPTGGTAPMIGTAPKQTEGQAVMDYEVAPLTYSDAVSYANTWYNSRNCAFADYSPPNGGGDCANFVSQCMYSGGIATDGTWNLGTSQGDYCPAGSGIWRSGYTGSQSSPWAWANNGALRDWIINSLNGQDASSNIPWMLFPGDTINYGWSCGERDHITLVVQSQSSNQPCLVASHTADGIYYWTMGGACTYWGTNVYYPYSCGGCH